MSFKIIPRINLQTLHTGSLNHIRRVMAVMNLLHWLSRAVCPSSRDGSWCTTTGSPVNTRVSPPLWRSRPSPHPDPSEQSHHEAPLWTWLDRHRRRHGQWTNSTMNKLLSGIRREVRKLRIFLFLFYFGPRESRFSKIFNLKYMFCFGKAQNLLKQFDSLALWCLRGFTTLTHKNCFSSSKHKTRKDSQHKMWHHVSSSDDYQVMYHITVKSVLGKNLHLLWQQLIVGWLYIMTNKWLQRANLSSSSVALLRC